MFFQKDEKYRCSETGYRIPFKCIEIKASSKEVNNNKGKKNRSALEDTYTAVRPHVMKHNEQALTSSVRQRNLLDDSSSSKSVIHMYITYRSCVLSINEEKLSVLGFEVSTCFFCFTKLSCGESSNLHSASCYAVSFNIVAGFSIQKSFHCYPEAKHEIG